MNNVYQVVWSRLEYRAWRTVSNTEKFIYPQVRDNFQQIHPTNVSLWGRNDAVTTLIFFKFKKIP